MNEKVNTSREDNKELIKLLIKKLHDGEDPSKIKQEFKEIIKKLTPLEISEAEEMLIKEGMPAEEIHHMCDVHLAVLQESLQEETDLAPEGHPVHILMQEHAVLLEFANNLRDLYKIIKEKNNYAEIEKEMEEIVGIVNHFKASISHYQREENTLFPYLEKHGVTQPPKIMWMDHDQIREIEKNLYQVIENHKEFEFNDFVRKFHTSAHALAELLASHFSKENRVLFPTALQVCSEDEWIDMRTQFDEIGYCCFTPEVAEFKSEIVLTETKSLEDNVIDIGTGKLTLDELKMIFKTLPIDLTFVGKDEKVVFYSEGPDRIFVRTPSVIGRNVENCHPQKSVHKVIEIVEGFKNGTLDKAEFWLELGEKFVYIRYFPVKNREGEFQGVLEVTQDISDIRKIEGEKRLL
ncbi:MAG: DUF438 domain-containing protein [Candidatus Heimdallarchaeota archaeon]|nr:DUF438 domain-containing protein [Candidatus Heimdallarchaeota archaeon]MCK4954862.1 DUF438 domain-containing protein [Candidatus Heimdallarchaeota archaeon]